MLLCSPLQAMTKAADKVSEKAVPVTEKATTKIQEKAAQVLLPSLILTIFDTLSHTEGLLEHLFLHLDYCSLNSSGCAEDCVLLGARISRLICLLAVLCRNIPSPDAPHPILWRAC